MMVDIMMGVMEVEEGTVDVAEGEVVDLEAEEEVSEGHGNFKARRSDAYFLRRLRRTSWQTCIMCVRQSYQFYDLEPL